MSDFPKTLVDAEGREFLVGNAVECERLFQLGYRVKTTVKPATKVEPVKAPAKDADK